MLLYLTSFHTKITQTIFLYWWFWTIYTLLYHIIWTKLYFLLYLI